MPLHATAAAAAWDDFPHAGQGPAPTSARMPLRLAALQIFGKEQAAKFPETEAWAAPFIWCARPPSRAAALCSRL